MKYERTLIAITEAGEKFSTKIVADNYTISVFRNGYSNWDGKRNLKGFRVGYTCSNGTEDTTFAATRKEAILEVAHRIVPYKKRRGMTYTLVKHT